MDVAQAASDLVGLAEQQLDPLWARSQQSSVLMWLTLSTDIDADQASEAYIRIANKWLDLAQRILATNDPAPEIDTLGAKLDEIVDRRRTLQQQGYGKGKPLEAAADSIIKSADTGMSNIERALQDAGVALGVVSKNLHWILIGLAALAVTIVSFRLSK